MSIGDQTVLEDDDDELDALEPIESLPDLGPGALEPMVLPSLPAEPQVAHSIRLAPGEVVPGTRYRIVRWLGEGRTGVVYEGSHVDIERRVALKILRPENSVGVRAAAFRREARTTSRIGSPYIVEVLDFTPLADGRLMFAMEPVDGKSLSSLVRDAPVPLARLLPILRQICKGLAAAHAEGVVHRDIKPDNVLLFRRDERDDAIKLVDFGIATIARVGEFGEHASAGTPRYMAPEQIEGESIDGRVDLYGLGCTAYALLTGQPPFDGKDVEEVFLKHAEQEPPPLPEDVPHDLAQAIMKCLAKNPEDRFASAPQLEAALCDVQIRLGIGTVWDDLPLPEVDGARKQVIADGFERLSPEKANPRRVWPVGLALALALLALVFWLAWPPTDAPENDHQVIDLQTDARAAAAKAYFVVPPVSDPSQATAYRFVQKLEGLEGDLELQGRTAGAELRQEFADTLVRLGDDFWERAGGKAFAMDFYAWALVFQPDRKRARERVYMTPGEMAMLRRRAETGEFTEVDRETAELLVALADEDTERRRSKVAAVLTEGRSLSTHQLVEGFIGEKSASKVRTRPEPLAVATGTDGGDPQEANRETESDTDGEGSELSPPEHEEKAGPPKAEANPKRAAALVVEGNALRKKGRLDAAATKYRQALEQHEGSHAAMFGLGEVAFEQGAYPEALRHLRTATKKAQVGRYYLTRALTEEKLQKLTAARHSYKKAKELGAQGADAAFERFLARQGE